MPSADTDTESQPDEVVDEARAALLEAVAAELGDAVADTHVIPGRDLWIRVTNEAWGHSADYLHNRQRFRFFDWLSVIDWLPSPFGRSHDAEVDKALAVTDAAEAPAADDDTAAAPATGADGYAGGNTRFQAVARVYNLSTKLGVNIKADIGDDLTIATWTDQYPGADWHEREAFEMFGVRFAGHPGLRNLYLPGDFEGHPLRKDFPLLARLVKPWPGIVDVEPMPSLDNPEDAS